MFTKVEKMAVQVKKHLCILACMFSICSVMPNVAQAIPFSAISQVYFFGDSLTDSGFNNNFTALNGFPTKAPTFTTYAGYTWSQYVARDIKGYPLPPPQGPFPVSNQVDQITNNTTPLTSSSFGAVIPDLTGIDYACGGSRANANPGFDLLWAPSLHQQIQNYLSTASPQLDPNAMYFVWSGANDLLAALSQQPLPTQVQLLQVADATTTAIVHEVALLSARGAKRIVVMSLPNVGSTPLINGLALQLGDPTFPASIKNVSFIFDSLLNQKLGMLMMRYPVKILYFDTYTALDNLIVNAKLGLPSVIDGQAFYFTNYTSPACGNASAILCPNTSNGYIFADTVHPTDMAHRALSLEVERRIKSWS